MFGRLGKIGAIVGLMVIGLVAVLALPQTTQAEDVPKPANSMTLSPAKDYADLEPGQRFDGSFKIINSGSEPFDFRVYVKPFAVGADCVDQYEESGDFNIMTRWINFDQNNYYDIQPDQTQVVTFHVDVPKDAPAGGQYVVIFAESGNFDTQAGAAIGVERRIGYKFFANLGGENIESGKVESLKQKTWFWEPPIIATGKIRNSGNTYFVGEHRIEITTLGGKEKYTGSQEVDVLPDTCRRTEVTWEGTPSFGIFWVTNTVEFFGQEQFNSKKLVIVLPIYIVVIFSIMAILLIWALVLKIKGRHQAAFNTTGGR
ncbi:hypothetical protein FWH58_02495 [Candidatus Saccharibacteria bacterium]|nr:hypothetical protein [Candidatus Saccharibacteria bacterium]